MSKAVLLSIRPEWVELIASGKKTIEVRKSRPKLKTPFKCYIYCTMGKDTLYSVNGQVQPRNSMEIDLKRDNMIAELNGYVVGEFVCDRIVGYQPCVSFSPERLCFSLRVSGCLKAPELWKYSDGKTVYGWHISALKMYDEPRKLSEFYQCHKCEYYSGCIENEYGCDGAYKVQRPPQSWMYVEELTT